MLLEKIAKMTKNVIIVVGTTQKASRAVLLLEKFVINVVVRTTLKLYVDPVKGQGINVNLEKGQIEPVVKSAYTYVLVHEIGNEDCHNDNTGIKDLTNQVQSLFYH